MAPEGQIYAAVARGTPWATATAKRLTCFRRRKPRPIRLRCLDVLSAAAVFGRDLSIYRRHAGLSRARAEGKAQQHCSTIYRKRNGCSVTAGCDADWFGDALSAKGIYPSIPDWKSRPEPLKYDKRRYRCRGPIEMMFCRLKEWLGVATRYDRCIAALSLTSPSPQPSPSGFHQIFQSSCIIETF